MELVWAQDQHFKLYRDGSLYAVADRHEVTVIRAGDRADADAARVLLQGAIDAMPRRAGKLSAGQPEAGRKRR